MSALAETFGPPIHVYTRAQAIEDGLLVDLTEWAGPKAIVGGGFKGAPVFVTRAVWTMLESPTAQGGDLRGRAHDVLWMALLVSRHAVARGRVGFKVILPTKGHRARNHVFALMFDGEAFTIGLPSED